MEMLHPVIAVRANKTIFLLTPSSLDENEKREEISTTTQQRLKMYVKILLKNFCNGISFFIVLVAVDSEKWEDKGV